MASFSVVLHARLAVVSFTANAGGGVRLTDIASITPNTTNIIIFTHEKVVIIY